MSVHTSTQIRPGFEGARRLALVALVIAGPACTASPALAHDRATPLAATDTLQATPERVLADLASTLWAEWAAARPQNKRVALFPPLRNYKRELRTQAASDRIVECLTRPEHRPAELTDGDLWHSDALVRRLETEHWPLSYYRDEKSARMIAEDLDVGCVVSGSISSPRPDVIRIELVGQWPGASKDSVAKGFVIVKELENDRSRFMRRLLDDFSRPSTNQWADESKQQLEPEFLAELFCRRIRSIGEGFLADATVPVRDAGSKSQSTLALLPVQLDDGSYAPTQLADSIESALLPLIAVAPAEFQRRLTAPKINRSVHFYEQEPIERRVLSSLDIDGVLRCRYRLRPESRDLLLTLGYETSSSGAFEERGYQLADPRIVEFLSTRHARPSSHPYDSPDIDPEQELVLAFLFLIEELTSEPAVRDVMKPEQGAPPMVALVRISSPEDSRSLENWGRDVLALQRARDELTQAGRREGLTDKQVLASRSVQIHETRYASWDEANDKLSFRAVSPRVRLENALTEQLHARMSESGILGGCLQELPVNYLRVLDAQEKLGADVAALDHSFPGAQFWVVPTMQLSDSGILVTVKLTNSRSRDIAGPTRTDRLPRAVARAFLSPR
ncbi:MAG: hypothetical protein AB7O52_06820 [Planctomycetota bacterium]